jgi:hypothetical protein
MSFTGVPYNTTLLPTKGGGTIQAVAPPLLDS